MKYQSSAVLLGMLVSVTFASRAWALPTIDFGIFVPTTGSISYGGGATPLQASNLEVDHVVGLDTPLNNNVLRNCIACTLSFTTGNFSGSTANTWNFGPGGSINVVGGVDLNDDGDAADPGDIPVGTTLLAGSFTGSPTLMAFAGMFRVVGAGFVDVKDAVLAAFYGLAGGPGNGYTGGLNISFNSTGTPPNSFVSSTVISGNVVNQPGSGGQQAPLPSTALLLLSGIGAAVWARRRSDIGVSDRRHR